MIYYFIKAIVNNNISSSQINTILNNSLKEDMIIGES